MVVSASYVEFPFTVVLEIWYGLELYELGTEMQD